MVNRIINQTPPYECVPWFNENFKAGDIVSLLYRGGLGGTWEAEGKISHIERPEIYLEGHSFSYTMADIHSITKH